MALTRNEVPPGYLTDLPFYRSVWTTLHAMAWSDMSFFSDPSRHGFRRNRIPANASARGSHPRCSCSGWCRMLSP